MAINTTELSVIEQRRRLLDKEIYEESISYSNYRTSSMCY